MKTLNLIFATILVNLFTFHATAQNRKTYSRFMQFSATVVFRSVPTNNYSVILYKDGVKMDSVFNKEPNSIDYYLQVNQVYTLVFQKDGCEKNMVIVNTTLPNGVKGFDSKSNSLLVNMSSIVSKPTSDNEDFPDEVLIINQASKLVSSESYHQFIQSSKISNSIVNK